MHGEGVFLLDKVRRIFCFQLDVETRSDYNISCCICTIQFLNNIKPTAIHYHM